MIMQNKIKENLLQIQEDIAPCKPNIIAVTKYFDENAIISAYNAGLRNFGESRAIDAIKKINNLPNEIRKNSKFHFIGHLQTNKARKVVENFDVIHSVDSLRLAQIISKEAESINKEQKILIQVNNAGEEQKSGFSEADLFKSFPEICKLASIKVLGLMNMAPLEADEAELDRLFGEIHQMKCELEQRFGYKLDEISMGMSRDYKIAVKNGATMIRIGRKLFK